MSSFDETHTLSVDVINIQPQKPSTWNKCLHKALAWRASLKIHKRQGESNPPAKPFLKLNRGPKRHKSITKLFKLSPAASMSSGSVSDEGRSSVDSFATNFMKIPRGAKVEQDWMCLSTDKPALTRDVPARTSSTSSDLQSKAVKERHTMEMLQGLIYEEGYTIEDIGKLLRISSTNYAVQILTNQKRSIKGQNTEMLRVRVDYAIAVMATRKGVTLDEIAETLKIPTSMWVMRTTNIYPALGPLSFDCTFSSLLPTPEIEKDDSPSPWILSVFVMAQDNSTPTRAQCTFDTGNYQGNIASRAFLEVLGYTESTFELLADDENFGGIDASGNTLLPLGAVNLTWYAHKSTKLFRNVRFLVSPHPHYDLIIGASFIEKHSLLGPPNLTITKGKSENRSKRLSSGIPAQLITNSLRLPDREESDQGDIATPPSSIDGAITEVSPAVNKPPVPSTTTTSLPDIIKSELSIPTIHRSVTSFKRLLQCEEDVPMTENGHVEPTVFKLEVKKEAPYESTFKIPFQSSSSCVDALSPPIEHPVSPDLAQGDSSSADSHPAPLLMEKFDESEQSVAITAAVIDIKKNLSSFATSYLISKFESQSTQHMGKSQGTPSGCSTKGNVDGKEKVKQRENGKRRRTSKNGAYENGEDEEKEHDDDDCRQEQDKDGPVRAPHGGWGCIFHIVYPDWYHPQNPCLSPKSQQKFNLCATKSFRRLDELVNHIIDVHQLPEFVCVRCRAEFSSQEQHYDHSIACERKAFRNIKFGIDQKMRQELSALPKKPRDQTFLDRWLIVFNIIFPGDTPPSPYFEEGAKRFGKYNTYLKDKIPNLARKYLEKATNEMKLEDELRQCVQVALDRLIDNSFPDILRDASESFRAQEIADRNQAAIPSQCQLPPTTVPSPGPSSSTHSSDAWPPPRSSSSQLPPHTSLTESNNRLSFSTSTSQDTETGSVNRINYHQEHSMNVSPMTQKACSSLDIAVVKEKQEPHELSAAQINLQIQTPEVSMFEAETGWEAAEVGDMVYDWHGVGFGNELGYHVEDELDEWQS